MNPYTTNGAFSWAELQTTNPDEATRFYEHLLDWESESMPLETGPYTVVKAGGIPAGGIMALQQEQIPPHWALYVTVTDIERISKRAVELGGTVLLPVMEVATVGQLCGIQDPSGARVMAIQYPESVNDGPDIDFLSFFKTHGAFSWAELRTPDMEGAISFYSDLFGWTVKIDNSGPGPYGMIYLGEVGIGGISGLWTPDMPPHWIAYVTVDNVDDTALSAELNGGSVTVPPTDIPNIGRFSWIQDPQGAQILVITYVEATS